jgi:hypothetical protein
MRLPLATTALILPLVALAGCGSEPGESDAATTDDPIAVAALNDQIMVDPDLANQNEANAALTGSTNRLLPPENTTPEAIAAAREEALALVGGGSKLAAPAQARVVEGEIPVGAMLTAAARAALAMEGGNCAERVEYSTVWAARLPDALPVYPRGSTQEAAGTDKNGCALRVVNFLTPVPLEDVLAFYNTRAKQAGYSVEHLHKDGDNILSGTKNGASYVIYARRLNSGTTEVDLVTSNG